MKAQVITLIRQLAKRAGTPETITEAILARLLPSIRLRPQTPDGTPELPGTSHIGGLPDLPAWFTWPPLAFLMQLNLAELAPFDLENVLPHAGMLYLFFDIVIETEFSCVRLLQDDTASLCQRAAPADLPIEQQYQGFRLRPSLEWTVPSPYDLGLEEAMVRAHLALWDTLEEEVARVQGYESYHEPKHRLLGHPQLIQSPGLAEGTRLLLQVDSDCVLPDSPYPRTGMMWGDAGRVYYLLTEEELQAGNVEYAEAFWECS